MGSVCRPASPYLFSKMAGNSKCKLHDLANYYLKCTESQSVTAVVMTDNFS